jgi:hypothetical protein
MWRGSLIFDRGPRAIRVQKRNRGADNNGVATIQPYVTPVTLGGLGLTVALAVLGCLSALLARQVVPVGWRALRPGFGHWFAALGSAAFSILVAWVYLFVGSARRDAAFQMKVAFLLSIAFALCAVYAAWRICAIKHENTRWRGTRIVRRGRDGQEHVVDLGRAFGWRRTFSGLYVLAFADGSILAVDPFTRGSDAFMADFGPTESAEDPHDPPS